MSDDELAAIADYHNHDTYIYDDTNKTAIIYQKKNYNNRPIIVLYNVGDKCRARIAAYWPPANLVDNMIDFLRGGS
jgi:hypothetical protein